MVRQFQYIAYRHDRFRRDLLYRKLDAILVIYTDKGNTRLVPSKHFVMQRTEGIKFFYTPGLLQCLDTQLVAYNDMGLEAMFLVSRLPFLIQLAQVFLIKVYFHCLSIGIHLAKVILFGEDSTI